MSESSSNANRPARVILGIDGGSGSVGSAWIDLDQKIVDVGVSVFPEGVDKTDKERGAPMNQARRMKRQMRRGLARRAQRKRLLRSFLIEHGLLPSAPQELRVILEPTNVQEAEQWDPWRLRVKGLNKPLTKYEFGRVLLHLNQRRGAMGLRMISPNENGEKKTDPAGLVKAGIQRAQQAMNEQTATFGELRRRVEIT